MSPPNLVRFTYLTPRFREPFRPPPPASLAAMDTIARIYTLFHNCGRGFRHANGVHSGRYMRVTESRCVAALERLFELQIVLQQGEVVPFRDLEVLQDELNRCQLRLYEMPREWRETFWQARRVLENEVNAIALRVCGESPDFPWDPPMHRFGAPPVYGMDGTPFTDARATMDRGERQTQQGAGPSGQSGNNDWHSNGQGGNTHNTNGDEYDYTFKMTDDPLSRPIPGDPRVVTFVDNNGEIAYEFILIHGETNTTARGHAQRADATLRAYRQKPDAQDKAVDIAVNAIESKVVEQIASSARAGGDIWVVKPSRDDVVNALCSLQEGGIGQWTLFGVGVGICDGKTFLLQTGSDVQRV